MDLLQEYSELKKTIDYHMDRYYNQDEPEISDYEYDKLMIRLKEIEKEHPEWVTSDSPSQKIGGTVKEKPESRSHIMYLCCLLKMCFQKMQCVHGLIRFMPCILTAHFQ